jgi:hypothetical protein
MSTSVAPLADARRLAIVLPETDAGPVVQALPVEL